MCRNEKGQEKQVKLYYKDMDSEEILEEVDGKVYMIKLSVA